jgi:hypothetical protein
MQRDPLIIHLYDKPHRRRSHAQHSVAPPDYGSAVLSCTAIVLFVGVFFWAYDAIAHRETPFVPAMTAAYAPRSSLVAAKLIPPEAPAPDLHSPAVSLANADVPAPPTASPETAATAPEKATPVHQQAEAPPKKRRVRAVRPLPPEATQAYASQPGFFRVPYGGF